ncbi:MAG: NAD(P)H-hydrate dehydratase [Ectobacillus sp.]
MYIYSEEEIRRADKRAEERGLSVATLMENAGRSLYEALAPRITKGQRIAILSGAGNNGGDGIVLARYLQHNGYEADLLLPLGAPKTKAAQVQLQYYRGSGYEAVDWDKQKRYDVIVDALLGIGARLPLEGIVTEAVKWANEQEALRIAIDIPTGVTANCGYVEEAFMAHRTFCLHGAKHSAFLEPSAHYYGELEILDIGLPHEATWKIWTEDDVKNSFPKRPDFSHKGTFKTGLLLAGSDDMPGSMLLAALGAMRSGIGKLVIGTTQFAASIAAARLPEATYLFNGLEKAATGYVPEGIKAAAVGPGLEDKEMVERALQHLFLRDIPLIVDAGALHKRRYPRMKAPVVLTPHPGEFSRMIDMPIWEIQQNRIELASSYAKAHKVIVVLKGRYTVIAFPDGSGVINPTGNTGLAKGGSGDTLTGMLLAFLCTTGCTKEAVANAVYIHGFCADKWKENKAEAAMLASDISGMLPYIMKEFQG